MAFFLQFASQFQMVVDFAVQNGDDGTVFVEDWLVPSFWGYDGKTTMSESDIVVGVTAEHADALKRKFPAYADKIITFPLDVRAPSAGDKEGYDACFFSLCDGIEKILYPDGSKWKPKSEK